MHSGGNTEKYQDIIKKLSLIDNLEEWHWYIPTSELPKEDKKYIYDSAERLWIKRKITDGSLIIHPEVREELIEREYNPLPIHKKMIWASLLASYNGIDKNAYIERIRKKITKKYGREWWDDINRRIKPTYIARQRLLEQINSTGPALKYAASQSLFFGSLLSESRDDVLKKIPKK
ncbi:hypothetical protein [Providencia sp. JUb39]|uniref:hypothetical protein n=1 Tax=Providencia sp. JUb39 TaxID=2724165 RepID=UPI00164ECFFF|nr:hypothetical protein [Providencia sp. JUb39]MBC5788720.1 hypothetical protein [Providencia sp. JUb39]